MNELEYQQTYANWITQGIEAVELGNIPFALRVLSNVRQDDLTPLASSYLAYCLAREHRRGAKAVNMALRAVQAEEKHPIIYLNLGRIYLTLGKSQKALQAYRRGLQYQRNPLLLHHIEMICPRQTCTLPFLKRSNPVNVLLGRLRARLFSGFSVAGR